MNEKAVKSIDLSLVLFSRKRYYVTFICSLLGKAQRNKVRCMLNLLRIIFFSLMAQRWLEPLSASVSYFPLAFEMKSCSTL